MIHLFKKTGNGNVDWVCKIRSTEDDWSTTREHVTCHDCLNIIDSELDNTIERIKSDITSTQNSIKVYKKELENQERTLKELTKSKENRLVTSK